jgi:RNA 2',3'-cyclic 3'-phosphodiesterase
VPSKPPVEPFQRLFVAIDPPPEVLTHLGAVIDTLEVSRANAPGHSTRLTGRDSWHITVAFLGDVPADRVAAAVEAMRASASRATPLRLAFGGGGTFGRGRSTILWAGLDGDVPGLRRLGSSLRRDLRRARLPLDAKPLHPHLTISRPGERVSREQVAADVETLSGYAGPEWTADAIHLMVSEIQRTDTGPKPLYTSIATAPFGPPQDDAG